MRLVGLALAAVLTLPEAGDAAPRPQITDPPGDQLAVAGAGYDIVSALFSTTGTTRKIGRKRVYVPHTLVVTTTYAGDVPAEAHASQVVQFDLDDCANVYLQRYGAETTGSADCLGDRFFDFRTAVKGRTLTFTVPFKTIGSSFLGSGSRLTNLQTYTAYAEPVLGYETGQFTDGGAGALDQAETTAPFDVP